MIAPVLKGVIAAALVAAAPLAAGAGTCPTKTDLDAGIRLTRLDPFFSVVFVDRPDGLAEARVMERDGVPQIVDTVYTHALAVQSRLVNGGTLSVTYADDPGILDSLPSFREWSTTVTLAQNGNVFTQGTYSVFLTGFGSATVGGCDYDVWRVRDILNLDNGAVIAFEKSYAPELGLVVGSIQLGQNDVPLGSVFFDEIVAE